MLKKILSISGKQGLFKLLSYGKKAVIVESILDGKRMPASARDKMISLGDVAIYTTGDDMPLAQVFETIYSKFDGKLLDASLYKTPQELGAFFKEVLPTFDEDRVYKTDIKKVITWYNILVNAGFTKFTEEENADEATEAEDATSSKKDQ